MTCVVGIVESGEVWIGADSATVRNCTVRALKKPKVFRNGPFVIGYTSSFRMGQLLQYSLEVKGQEQDMPDEEYMVRVFIEAVRKCLKDHGFLQIDNNLEKIGRFLVGYRSGLYWVDSDLQITQNLDGMMACGSGEEFALGAMYALQGMAAQKRIVHALEIAAYFDANVVSPFAVMKV